MRTLGQALEDAAIDSPGLTYTFQNMKGQEKVYTFPEMEEKTAAIAAGIRERGIKQGDRLGLIIVDPEEFVLTFIAAIRLGVIPVPLYPPMALSELDKYVAKIAGIVTNSEAKLLVVSEQVQNLIWQLVDSVPTLNGLVKMTELLGAERIREFPEIDPNGTCFLQYTSGSTSDPKGVVVTHANLEANCNAICDGFLELKKGQGAKAISWLPLYHDMGLIGFVIAPLYLQLQPVFIPTLRFLKQPNVWMQTIHKHRGYVTFCPPFALGLAARRASEKHLEEWDLSCLKVLGVGAEPIQPEGVRQFEELFSKHCGFSSSAITPAYGMAEATLAMTLKPFDEPIRMRRVDRETFQDEGVARDVVNGSEYLEHVSCGTPLGDHDVAVFNARRERLPEGAEGQIHFRGPSVARGYFRDEAGTREAFADDGWLATGDLGYIYDGQLWVTGRVKDLVIIRGRNLHPQSIEWALFNVEGVRKGNVVAFSVPGDGTEDLVIAVEVAKIRDGLADDIRAMVSAEFNVSIKDIALLEPATLPKTSSGKLQRRRTRQLYLAGKLGREGSRRMGASGDKITVAKHLARSMWSRVKHNVANLGS